MEDLLKMVASGVAKALLRPKGIYYNPISEITTVVWYDGSKTQVKKMEDEAYSEYNAFNACLAKKIFGSNTQVEKIVSMTKTPIPKKNAKFEKHYNKRMKASQKKLEKYNENYIKQMPETQDLEKNYPKGYATLFSREDDCKGEDC